jgi:hypothetical protein
MIYSRQSSEVDMYHRIYTIIKRRVKRKLTVAIYKKPKVVRASTLERAQHYIDNHGCPTTRCFPRTTDDAFRHLGDGMETFFPPEKDWRSVALFISGVCCWAVLGFYFWRAL